MDSKGNCKAPFWIVWSPDSLLIAGNLKRYECEAEAKEAAAQAARINRGARYHVMQSRMSCAVADLVWTMEAA